MIDPSVVSKVFAGIATATVVGIGAIAWDTQKTVTQHEVYIETFAEMKQDLKDVKVASQAIRKEDIQTLVEGQASLAGNQEGLRKDLEVVKRDVAVVNSMIERAVRR